MKAAGFLAIGLGVSALWASSAETPITTAGWGKVHVGMRVGEAGAAGFTPSQGFSGTEHCHYIQSPKVPNLRVMVEAGRIVRVETSQPRYATLSGVRVGDAEGLARQVYGGRAVVRPHKYVEGAHYLIVYASDRTRAVVLEVVDGKVVAIRGGLVPAVEYVEGCS